MMLASSLPVIVAGFSLGLLHALDADHVMAVSALSTRKAGRVQALKCCAHWALGHAGVVLGSGLLLFGLGYAVPATVQHWAEVGIGVLMIALGLIYLWRFRQQGFYLMEHRHGDVVHTHWQAADHTRLSGEFLDNTLESGRALSDSHTPVLVGMLHGLAGSAPALALVPVVTQGQLAMALVYLVVFSLGVMLSMLFFGWGLSVFQRKLRQCHVKLFYWHRYAIASGAIFVGGFWLAQSF